jgi:hypothetical protein
MTAVPQSGPITRRPFSLPSFFKRISSSIETLSLKRKTCNPLARASLASLAAYSPGTDIAAIPASPAAAASDRVA